MRRRMRDAANGLADALERAAAGLVEAVGGATAQRVP